MQTANDPEAPPLARSIGTEKLPAVKAEALRNLVTGSVIEVDRDELAHCMGYPSPASVSAPVRDVCDAQIRRLADLANPWGGCIEIPIRDVGYDTVQLEGGSALSSRRLARLLRRATSIELLIVTLGESVGLAIRQETREGSVLDAMALDAAATVATSALMREMRERVCRKAIERGLGTTIRYGPGYTDWKIDDMAVLFSCLEGRSVPVRLNDQLMMLPEKSLLGIVGLVPGKRSAPDVIPCRICDLERCSSRRAPFTGRP